MKDKANHDSSVVYEGKCSCCKDYIGETGRNVSVRSDEHSDVGKNSEPAKHFNQFPAYRFIGKFSEEFQTK